MSCIKKGNLPELNARSEMSRINKFYVFLLRSLWVRVLQLEFFKTQPYSRLLRLLKELCKILKNPVTIPCGHSFCMECVRSHWDNPSRTDQDVSCPLCRTAFPARPELCKNLTLSELLERWQPVRQAPVTEASSSSEDVLCDFCTDEKEKAAKSCLVCMASYCASHLQTHYRNAVFQSHQLVPPVRHIESVCRVHLQPMQGFCKTDQKCICQICASQDHKDHEVVPAEQEKAEREAQQLEMLKGVEIQIQELGANISKTRNAMDLIQSSALKEKEQVQKQIAEAVGVLENFREEVTGFIESEEKSILGEAKENFKQLEVRHRQLKQQKQKLEQVASTDTISFIQQFQALKIVAEEKRIPAWSSDKELSFTKSGQTASAVKELLLLTCRRQGDQLKRGTSDLDTQLEESSVQLCDGADHSATSELRAFFLPYACEVDLDSDTAETSLALIGTKEVKRQTTPLNYPANGRRFKHCAQVLGKELERSSYWEVELLDGWVSIGVATNYHSPNGSYEATRLGRNSCSWCLCCHGQRISVLHNNEETILYRKPPRKLGVHLDFDGCLNATLTFYDVKGTQMVKYSQFKIVTHSQRIKLKLYPAFYLESVGAHLRIPSE
ncbi:E3 ubiquitin-protein ligase TRIM47-like [Rhinatrema bivittatum]|uniref:E3 ubiquitin-protein ligase TRIM47-like n=1 Tax=Rhinatrema bivittatum TaxID=194408 RepID=UPI00112CE01D|nr:E3 ubiquitin-protein ligase TRIM47-like [Rhinatrema bivittatum]